MSDDQELKIYHLDDGGEDWWIAAYSAEDALEIGNTMDIEEVDGEEITVTEMPMDKELTIALIDGYDSAERGTYPAEPYRGDNGYWKVTATIREWLSVHKRGDVIASSLF